MDIKQATKYIKESLKGIYPATEIEAFTKIIFSDVFNINAIEFYTHKDKKLSEHQIETLKNIIGRLLKHEPLQYIIGFTEFYDLKFEVNSNVLIPRQETEELVDLIIKKSDNNETFKILDIGTGSGCIALSLKNSLPKSTVTACDFSDEALEMAKLNAKINNLDLEFLEIDILNEDVTNSLGKFDLIVSNPPYVRELEKEMMSENVLDYEPEMALFVDDNDPLIYYNAITNFALNHLKKGGRLYFEINEFLGKEMKNLLLQSGFKDVIVYKDLNNKDRMTSARL